VMERTRIGISSLLFGIASGYEEARSQSLRPPPNQSSPKRASSHRVMAEEVASWRSSTKQSKLSASNTGSAFTDEHWMRADGFVLPSHLGGADMRSVPATSSLKRFASQLLKHWPASSALSDSTQQSGQPANCRMDILRPDHAVAEHQTRLRGPAVCVSVQRLHPDTGFGCSLRNIG
jgi:hypothetical protein